MNIRDIASTCHEANRAIQIANGDPVPSLPWDQAEQWQIESAIEGVKMALNGATPRQLHESWCREKIAGGWVYGETKNSLMLTHPCLIDYDELPADQRLKDHVFNAIVNAYKEWNVP